MIPNREDILNLPIAQSGEYELSDKETKRLRSRIYGINKDGIRRYRTLRDGRYVIVWRLK
jgi:hypothetical protein